MADRMLREDMRSSEKVNSWPIPLRYFWTQLWGYCDDWGRGQFENRLIKAGTFPIDDEVTAAVVGRWMKALELADVIAPYVVGGKSYFECVHWDEHQELGYRKKTKIPDRTGAIPTPGKVSRTFQNVSELSGLREEKRREVEEEVGSVNAPPSTFCNQHPTGTDTPCRRCGDARRAFKAWETAQKNTPTPRPPKRESTCDVHAEYPLPCIRCQENS